MSGIRGGASLRPTVTAAISEALFGELADRGYANTSMDAVARRAGVGKAALYRRWPHKEAMVLEIVAATVQTELIIRPDTGRFESDLREILSALRSQLGHPSVARIAPGLLAETATQEAFRDALWEAVAGPRRAVVSDVLEMAISRGDLPGDCDIDLAIDLVFAPLAFRTLVFGRPVDDRYFDVLLASTAAAVRAARRENPSV